MEFEVILKNDKIKSYRLLTLFILLINSLYFLYQLFDQHTRNSGLTALVSIAVYVLYRYWISRKKGTGFYLDEWVYFALMLLWIDNYLFAILNLVFMLQYTAATQLIIYIFGEEIRQKNFPWKKYQWSELSNIILKDNILTMDFNNNKIIQGELENEVGQKEFNAFVSGNLNHNPG